MSEKNIIIKTEVNKEDPYQGINFVNRRAQIYDKDGKLIFDEVVEYPDFYDDNSVNITASKYLCNEAKNKETSLKQMLDRISNTITNWGVDLQYFDEETSKEFNYDLKYYQIHQFFSFNSPIYFNVGIREQPQCSACFILEVNDDMESIFETGKLESLIFKWGSGSGMNMSRLRSSKEPVRGGGNASGPVSFLKAHDTAAGVIKSGGTLRRSAKLACLDMDHPDILKFIHCKEKEEEKLRILEENGITADEGYEMSDHVFFQNTNISVRIPDEFMKSVEDDNGWWTRNVLNGEKCEKFKARELLRHISKLAWKTADPGIQFRDNINKWNTCKTTGEIRSSNPCGEFMAVDNTSCNLAALNLMKFFYINDKGEICFDLELFRKVITQVITAQDIIIDKSSYPSIKISNNSCKLRPLGLGFSNLGALLMWLGFPYDSDEARLITSAITALMTGIAYTVSNELAKVKGPFAKFNDNKKSFYEVIKLHKEHVDGLDEKIENKLCSRRNLIETIVGSAIKTWEYLDNICENGAEFRNSQVTLLAPTGTTSFLMGCSTTGIEPDFSLIKYKKLSGNGGAVIKIINSVVNFALENLGYQPFEIKKLEEELISKNHFENSKVLKAAHLPIFDTAIVPDGGSRSISYMAHINMLEAVQPFISGAISKTVNLAEKTTVDDIYNLYLTAWKKGLKGITIYRDGSKNYQPLANKEKREKFPKPKKLGDEREARIHKFRIGGMKGYITTGLYEDGSLGEVFLDVAKEGTTMSGLLDSIGIITSLALQHTHGTILKDLVERLKDQKFEPSGFTGKQPINNASSIVDYVFKYLGWKFLSEEDRKELGLDYDIEDQGPSLKVHSPLLISSDSPPCNRCGSMMVKKGSCFWCDNCGENSGSCSG